MKMVYAYPEDLAWMETRTGYCFSRNARGLLAVDAEGHVKGGVAYDNWMPASCEMHQAFEAPIAMRALLPEAFRYPFVKADKRALYGRIPECNGRAIQSAMHFGFQEVSRLSDAWEPGVDVIIMRLLRDECRYLKGAQ